MARVAVVTGSNRGIGFEIVRQLCEKNPSWIVYLTSRDVGRGEAAVKELQSSGVNPRYHQLDVVSVESIKMFADFLKKEHGGLDVLINNAGVLTESGPSAEQAVITTNTNYFGWLNVCKEMFPLLRDHARVANVSSRDGHTCYKIISNDKKKAFRECQSVEEVTDLVKSYVDSVKHGRNRAEGWSTPYHVSKLGMSVASIHQQKNFDQDKSRQDIIVNACCPGYIKTGMTHYMTFLREPSEGADTPVYLAMLPENCKEPRGKFVNERTVNDVYTGSDYYP